MAPEVLIGMYSFIILSSYFMYAYICITDRYLFSEFLVCSCAFDYGVGQSFIFQSFSRYFDMALGELECLLRVSISNKHKVSASSVFRD